MGDDEPTGAGAEGSRGWPSLQATALESPGGRDQDWPTSVMITRSRSAPATASSRRTGSSIGSRLSRKVEWWMGSRYSAPSAWNIRQASSGEAWLVIQGSYAPMG